MDKKMSFWEKLKAYRLDTKMWVCIALFIIMILSIVLYCQPGIHQDPIWSNITSAIFTSLLVSILVMLTELFVAYKDNERDCFLKDIHTFGINNLNKDKQEVLRVMLEECDSMIWISGYRLIMTYNLRAEFANAIARGANGVAVICPPWTQAFKLVYGENEKVMSNYFEIFHRISLEKKANNKSFDILFTDKPIFSDTYRIDQNLVSGPYMHNKDLHYNRLMAKDFFSYNLVKKSPLYDLIFNEFETLAEESTEILDWEKFDEAYEKRRLSDLNEADQIALLQSCIKSR